MLPTILKPNTQLFNIVSNETNLSNDLKLNYSKIYVERKNNLTSIQIDKGVSGKLEVSNTRTYTQNSVKKYDLTGNKEICIRKVFIADREDGLFDITVRELKVYYRKEKKYHFNKVLRFKSTIGTIEYVFELLKGHTTQKNNSVKINYSLG